MKANRPFNPRFDFESDRQLMIAFEPDRSAGDADRASTTGIKNFTVWDDSVTKGKLNWIWSVQVPLSR